MTYKCVRCRGPVTPGVNGLIRGLSADPTGDPAGAIRDTFEGLHYAEHCGDPKKPVERIRLTVPTEGTSEL